MPSLGFLKKKRTREGNSDPTSTSNPTSPVTPSANKSFDTDSTPRSSNTSASKALSQAGFPAKQENQGDAPEIQHPMNNYPIQQTYAPPQHTPSPGTEPQNLPTISNLINPPQQHEPYQQQIAGSRFPAPPTNGAQAVDRPQQPANMSQPQSQPNAQQQPVPTPDQVRVTKGKYSLADFEILRTLGTGSFGRVHLVQSRHNQRFYAIKVLKKGQVVKMKQVEHTNDERRMLGEVKNTFLITLWGTFQDSRNLYMVMDFVEGGELFSLLRKSGVSSWSSHHCCCNPELELIHPMC
jgi:protein kinase A